MTEFAFADIWEAVAVARGDAAAQVQGNRRLSWSQLDERADALAAALLATGADHQAKVANYLYNAPEYLEAVFGTVKAGFVPVNTNYRYGPDELSYLWDNADAVAVIFHGTFVDTIERVRPASPRFGCGCGLMTEQAPVRHGPRPMKTWCRPALKDRCAGRGGGAQTT
jgi:fatty-acyl-CoA synthase